MRIPLVDLKAQYLSIKSEIDAVMQEVKDKTSFIGGEYLERFEKNFANFCEAKYCVGTSSGTSAIRTVLEALEIKAGDEIITVPNTFIATTSQLHLFGAKPVFVDVEEDTFNINLSKLEKAVTKKTKIIMPVHLYGQPVEMNYITDLARSADIKIVEDACQAHGASYINKKIGSLESEASCFSFYPGKNLGAYGDGGAVVTNNLCLAERIGMLIDHGRKKGVKYEHEIEGNNDRLDALQAAILDVKLKYLDEWNSKRRANAQIYNNLLDQNKVITPKEADYAKHIYHLYVIMVENRDEVLAHLKNKGIFAGIHYPIPLHLQPAYRHLNLPKGSFPVAEKLSSEILSLPMYPELTTEQLQYVADTVNEVAKKPKKP